MEKYYTPEIEELLPNIEITSVDSDSKISNHLIRVEESGVYLFVDLEEMYKKSINNYKIKYLDKEDIESLGFTLFDRHVDNYCGDFFEYYAHEDNKVILEFQSCTPYITIRAKETREFPSKSYYWFQGNIKNKSELKKLLKQLCITK